jgi:antitoxin CcdA
MRMDIQSSSNRSRRDAATRPTNLSLSAALVEEAKKLGVNISLAADRGLEEAVKKARAERWLEENRRELDSSNEWMEANGLPLADLRLF